MPIYTVQDTTTGKQIRFEWFGKEPPTDSDFEEVFTTARQPQQATPQKVSPAIQQAGFVPPLAQDTAGMTPIQQEKPPIDTPYSTSVMKELPSALGQTAWELAKQYGRAAGKGFTVAPRIAGTFASELGKERDPNEELRLGGILKDSAKEAAKTVLGGEWGKFPSDVIREEYRIPEATDKDFNKVWASNIAAGLLGFAGDIMLNPLAYPGLRSTIFKKTGTAIEAGAEKTAKATRQAVEEAGRIGQEFGNAIREGTLIGTEKLPSTNYNISLMEYWKAPKEVKPLIKAFMTESRPFHKYFRLRVELPPNIMGQLGVPSAIEVTIPETGGINFPAVANLARRMIDNPEVAKAVTPVLQQAFKAVPNGDVLLSTLFGIPSAIVPITKAETPTIPPTGIQPVMPAMPAPTPAGLPMPTPLPRPNFPKPAGEQIEIPPSPAEAKRIGMESELQAAERTFQPKFDKVRSAQGIWSLMKGKVYIGSLEDNGFSADVLHKEYGIPYSFWNADPNKSQSLDSWAAENRDKFGIYDEDVPMSNVAIEALKDYAMSRGESDPYKRAITIPEKEGIIDLLGELEGIKQEIRRKYGQDTGTRLTEQIQRKTETEVDNTESGQVIAGANKELSANPEEIAAFANDLTPEDIDLIKQSIEQGLPETDIAAKAVRYLETQKKPAGIKEKTSEFATQKKAVLTIGDEVTVKGMERPVKIENIRTETDLTGKQYKEYFTKEGWIPEEKIIRKVPPKTEAEALFKTEEVTPEKKPATPKQGMTAEQALEQMKAERQAEREVQRLPLEKDLFKAESTREKPAISDYSAIDKAIPAKGKKLRWWEYYTPEGAQYHSDIIPLTREEAETFMESNSVIQERRGKMHTQEFIHRAKIRGVDTSGVEGYYILRGDIDFAGPSWIGRTGSATSEQKRKWQKLYEDIIKEQRETQFGKRAQISVAGRKDIVQELAGVSSKISQKPKGATYAGRKIVRGKPLSEVLSYAPPAIAESAEQYNSFFEQPASNSERQEIARRAREKKLSTAQINRLLKVYTGRSKVSDLTSEEAYTFLDILNGLIMRRGGKPTTIPRSEDIAAADFFVKDIKDPGLSQVLFEPWYMFKRIGIWDEIGKPLYDADERARNNTAEQFYKLRDWQNKAFQGVPHKQRADASRRIWEIADGTISPEELAKARPIEKEIADNWRKLAEEYADKLELPVEERQPAYISHIIEDLFRDLLASKYPFPEELSAIMQYIHTKEVFDPFLQKRLGFPIVKKDFFLSASRYIVAAEKKLAYDDALTKINPYLNATEGKMLLPASVVKYVNNVVNYGFLRRPFEQEETFRKTWSRFMEKLPPRKVKLPPEVAELVGQSVIKVPRTIGGKPATKLISKVKEYSYLSLIGGNIRTMVVNLTQPVAAFAKLKGWPHQTVSDMLYGYSKAISRVFRPSYWEAFEKAGLLPNVEGLLENPDQHIKYRMAIKDLLFWNMQISEFMNRVSSAYAGARNKMRTGTVDELIEIRPDLKKKAEWINRNLSDLINFRYGSLYRPVWTLSPVGQMIYHLNSFNAKQIQLLYDMAGKLKAGNLPKDFINNPGKTLKEITTDERGELIRYIIAAALVSSLLLARLGLKRKLVGKFGMLDFAPNENPVWRLFMSLVTFNTPEFKRLAKQFIPYRAAYRRGKRIMQEGLEGILNIERPQQNKNKIKL